MGLFTDFTTNACGILAAGYTNIGHFLKIPLSLVQKQHLLPFHQQSSIRNALSNQLCQAPPACTRAERTASNRRCNSPEATAIETRSASESSSHPLHEQSSSTIQVSSGPLQLSAMASQEGECYLTLRVSYRLLSVVNDFHQEKELIARRREKLAEFSDTKFRLKDEMHAVATGRKSALENGSVYDDAKLQSLRAKILRIEDYEAELTDNIRISEGNLEFGKSVISSLLETVFGQGDLLTDPTFSFDDSETDTISATANHSLGTLSQTTHTRQEYDDDEERQLARNTQMQYEFELMQAEQNLEEKEDRYQRAMAEYDHYKVFQSWTRSSIDRRLLLDGQLVTREVMKAEDRYNAAVEHAEALGAWDRSSAHSSGSTYHLEEAEDENPPLGPGTICRIETWLADVDISACSDVENVSTVASESEEEPIQISDSISACEEETSWRRKIRKYQVFCEGLRQELRES